MGGQSDKEVAGRSDGDVVMRGGGDEVIGRLHAKCSSWERSDGADKVIGRLQCVVNGSLVIGVGGTK